MTSVSPEIRHFVEELSHLQSGMLSAVAEQDWDTLMQHDMRCRSIYRDLRMSDLSADESTVLRESMEAFLEFHKEIQRSCTELRDVAAQELRRVKDAETGIAAYGNVKDQK